MVSNKWKVKYLTVSSLPQICLCPVQSWYHHLGQRFIKTQWSNSISGNFEASWSTSRILPKGSDPKPPEVNASHWIEEAFNFAMVLHHSNECWKVVGKVFKKSLLLLLREFIINRNKIPRCICWNSNNTSPSDSCAQLKSSQIQHWKVWRVKIHQKFECCSMSTNRKGLHLLLKQSLF